MPHAVMDVSKRVNENEPVGGVWQHGSERADRFSGTQGIYRPFF